MRLRRPTRDGSEFDTSHLDVWRWSPRVACRTVDGVAFILLDSCMVSLNETGTFLWNVFRQGTTMAKAAHKLVASFEVEIDVAERDVEKFVTLMRDRKLLVAQSQGQAHAD
jgi:hypothetical protein